MDVKVVLFKQGKGIIPKLIKWQTDSQYCHAALLFDDRRLLEAVFGRGVVQSKFVYDPAVHDVFTASPHLSDQDSLAIADFAAEQVGSGYDTWGCLRFISRRRLPENDKWFCSELVFAAFAAAGLRLLNNVVAQQVSPGDLAMSPYLTKVK